MDYIDQTVDSVRLLVARGAFSFNQLTVLTQETNQWKGYTIKMGVLAESHYVSFSSGDNEWHEICACTDIPIPDNVITHTYDKIVNLPSPVIVDWGEMNYSFSHSTLPWSEGQQKIQDMRTNYQQHNQPIATSEFVFPASESDSVTSLTLVTITGGDSMVVESVHEYSSERLVVHTRSVIS